MLREQQYLWWPIVGFVVAIGFHLWHLNQPPTLVSDEVFFVQEGHDYLLGHKYFDPHPPLGKLELGGMFTIFGYSPLTWRALNAVEGALMIPLVWWLTWRLTWRRSAAAIAMILVLLDGLLLVDSRLGLINVPYVLYSFGALACILQALTAKKPRWWLMAAGTLVGAGLSVKWLAALLAIPTVGLWFWPKLFLLSPSAESPQTSRWWSVGSLLVWPLVIYGLVFQWHFTWLHIPSDFWATNIKMLNYHLSVPTVGDPYAQPWWGWFLVWRPFVYWSQTIGPRVASIWSMGNPWMWWTGAAIFISSLITGWRQPARRLLNIFLLCAWLPFVVIPRMMYSYHALPFGLLLAMLIAVTIDRWRTKWWAIGYLVIASIVFIWFCPWWLNIPLSQTQFRLRQWLPSWRITSSAGSLAQASPTPRPVPQLDQARPK